MPMASTSTSTKSIAQTLKGKVAIVTGGSRGIGASIVLELVARGSNVVVVHSSNTGLTGLQEQLKDFDDPRTIWIRVDLRKPDAASIIVNEAVATFGSKIDILVNNAGCELNKPFSEITMDDYDYVYDLNVRAPILLTQAVIPYLPKTQGRIINVSSVGARCGFANLTLYCSSKGALEGLTRSLAAELGEKGHTVNAVAPGPIEGEMIEKIPKEIVKMQKDGTPLEKRLGKPQEVASVVAWLSEEGSSWLTGQVLNCSGGWTMY